MTSYGGEAVHIVVSREMLQPVLAAAVKEAIGLLESTIHKSGLTVDAVDTILLIGGSSQLWLLQEQLSSDSRFKGRYTIAGAPEWDVAHGAALLDREPGAYRIAETLALRLSDGSSIVLARPGDRPNGHRRTLSLVLAEDAAEAHLVIERRADGDTRGKPALQFSAPSLGFLEEEIQFNYGLTPELTFAANAASTRRPAGAVRDHEIEDLRFAYTLETQGI
jgi:molecular chaperone DnaK